MTVAVSRDRLHASADSDVLDKDLGRDRQRDLTFAELPRFVLVDSRIAIPGWRSVEHPAVVTHHVRRIFGGAMYYVDSDLAELMIPVETGRRRRDGREDATVLFDPVREHLRGELHIPDQMLVPTPKLVIRLLQVPSRRRAYVKLVPADRRFRIAVHLLSVALARSGLQDFDHHLRLLRTDPRNRGVQVHRSKHRAETLPREDRHVVSSRRSGVGRDHTRRPASKDRYFHSLRSLLSNSSLASPGQSLLTR